MKYIRLTPEQYAKLMDTGYQLSNICFNLSQDDKLDPRHRANMRECAKAWDNANFNLPAVKR